MRVRSARRGPYDDVLGLNRLSSRSPSAEPSWHNGDINQFLESNRHDRFKLCVGRRRKPGRGFGMTNVSEGDSPLLHIVLERIDAVRNVARYYVLSIEPTLFARHTLIGAGAASAPRDGNAFCSSGARTRLERKWP